MYSVTHTQDSDRIMHFYFASVISRKFDLAYIAHPLGKPENYRKYGIPPVDSERTNFIGDHECLHQNMTGDLFVFDDPAIVPTTMSFTYRDENFNLVTDVQSRVLIPAPTAYSISHLVDIRSDFSVSAPTVMAKPNSYTREYTNHELSVRAYDLMHVYVRLYRKFERIVGSTRSVTTTYYHYFYEFDVENWRFRVKTVTSSSPDWDWRLSTYGVWNVKPSSGQYTCTASTEDEDLCFNPEQIWDRVYGRTSTITSEDPSRDKFIWGDLAQVAASSTRYIDINTSMYAADFFKIATLLKPFVGLLRGDFSLKNLSGAYLAAHYGVRLTIKDTEELSEAIMRLYQACEWYPFKVAHARTSVNLNYVGPLGARTGERKYNLKMYYNPFDSKPLKKIRHAQAWDYLPTAANIWDFIPFSFVVDWFIGIQDELERWEHSIDMVSLDILSTLATERDEFQFDAATLFSGVSTKVVTGTLQVIRYNRRILAVPPQPISRLETPSSFGHWIEGTALLIQRIL